MEVQNIIEIAEDRMMSELCLKWYLEPDEQNKQDIYDNEILPLYKKINKILI
jgi:hypothetical protein